MTNLPCADPLVLLAGALDKGYQQSLQHLYEVLAAAQPTDLRSGVAVERFAAGLEKARSTYDAAVKAAEA